jgi:hypothetical protein
VVKHNGKKLNIPPTTLHPRKSGGSFPRGLHSPVAGHGPVRHRRRPRPARRLRSPTAAAPRLPSCCAPVPRGELLLPSSSSADPHAPPGSCSVAAAPGHTPASTSASSDRGTNAQLLAISARLLQLGSGDEHASPRHRPAPPPAQVCAHGLLCSSNKLKLGER